jgi:hypothetical protein
MIIIINYIQVIFWVYPVRKDELFSQWVEI